MRQSVSRKSLIRQIGLSNSGIVLAVNLKALIAAAESTDGVIELAHQVGDFVAVDEPLFKLYTGARLIDEELLRNAIAFGSERTIEQDPTFAFRIVVDIAREDMASGDFQLGFGRLALRVDQSGQYGRIFGC